MKRRILPTVLAVAAIVAGYVFREELHAWFVLQKPGEGAPAAAASAASPTHDGAPSPQTFPEPLLSALAPAYEAQEQARALLAADQLKGLAATARAAADALTAAKGHAPDSVARTLAAGARAAAELADSADLAAARRAYGELNRALVTLAEVDPRLQDGWHRFECPMAEGYQLWLQRGPQIENPYMGPRMLACGTEKVFGAAEPATESVSVDHSGHGHAGTDIAYHTCSMHPSVKQAEPGLCPLCNMTLTPVTFDELEGGAVLVDAVRRQEIGVKTGPVAKKPLRLEVRAVGRVAYDETRLHDVSLKLEGWVERLHVDATGNFVKKGQVLFEVYSPELYTAQQDYLLARRTRDRLSADGRTGERMGRLVEAAEARLRLLDLSPAQIAAIAKRGEPLRAVPFFAPASGYVVEKDVVEGAAVRPGQRVYRLAALDPVWVEADVFESDLPHVRAGMPAAVTLPHLPGRTFEGKVAHVYPDVDLKARTGRVRLELRNPGEVLKPGMYADVALRVELGERLQIPESAVLYTGPRTLVFIDLGEGRLRPQEVKLGAKVNGAYEVLGGLKEGQQVVTSGNFLLAAESRIRSAANYWGGEDGEDRRSEPEGGSHAGH